MCPQLGTDKPSLSNCENMPASIPKAFSCYGPAPMAYSFPATLMP